jgi:hypothetical protein
VTGTEYHNTLLVDGRGQYRPDNAGPSTDPAQFVGTDASIEVLGGSNSFDYLVADLTNRYRGKGSSPPAPGPRILDEAKRYVLFSQPDYFVMVDSLRASSPHLYEWVSHFGNSVSVEGSWVKGGAANGNVLGVSVVEPAGFVTDTGNDGKPYVRIRPSVGEVANARFVTVLFPTSQGKWNQKPDVSLIGDNGQAIGVRVGLNGIQDHLVNYSGAQTFVLGDYSYDGLTASVVKDPNGNLSRVFLAHGSHLSDSGGTRTLLQATATATSLEVDYAGPITRITGDSYQGARIYAPAADAGQVTVNGQPASASRDGDYIILK